MLLKKELSIYRPARDKAVALALEGKKNEAFMQVKEISTGIQQMANGSQQIVVSVRDIDTISKKNS